MSIIRQFWPMKVLHTDNGKEFKNRVNARLLNSPKYSTASDRIVTRELKVR
jgi:hypothetical protein